MAADKSKVVVSDKAPFDPSPFFISQFVLGRPAARRENRAFVSKLFFPEEYALQKSKLDQIVSKLNSEEPYHRRRTNVFERLFADNNVPLLPETPENVSNEYKFLFPENARQLTNWTFANKLQKDLLVGSAIGMFSIVAGVSRLANPILPFLVTAFFAPSFSGMSRFGYDLYSGDKRGKEFGLDQEDFWELRLSAEKLAEHQKTRGSARD